MWPHGEHYPQSSPAPNITTTPGMGRETCGAEETHGHEASATHTLPLVLQLLQAWAQEACVAIWCTLHTLCS